MIGRSILLLCALCLKFVGSGGESKEPVFLTPLVESNQIQEAQKKAQVSPPLLGNVKSYAGYYTVNKDLGSNMFFWYIVSEIPGAECLILWLQGGPGSSSLYGAFEEIGPYRVTEKNEIVLREQSWSKLCHLLFVDNPVGTGFSFTNDEKGYLKTQEDIANGLHETLRQFFKMFPETRTMEFYLAGESYAGKYIPSLGHVIGEKNQKASSEEDKINLKGVLIGNGDVDPLHMKLYAEQMYQLGYFNKTGRDFILSIEKDMKDYIEQKDWTDASIMDQVITGGIGYIFNMTGISNVYNYLKYKDDANYYENYVTLQEFRNRINVGNREFSNGDEVFADLQDDLTQSVLPYLEELANNYRMLLFSGQLDLLESYTSTLAFLEVMQWNGADEYRTTAVRKIWRMDGQVVGYSKRVNSFTELVVKGSGHIVPRDKPVVAFEMVRKFVNNEPFE